MDYTSHPPLRTPDIKNLGVGFAPERLRICPWTMASRKFFEVSGAISSKSSKKSRAARAKMISFFHLFTTDIVISQVTRKSEDPAKMTHSISDFLRRLRAQEYAKNMPMNRPGGLRMWAEANSCIFNAGPKVECRT